MKRILLLLLVSIVLVNDAMCQQPAGISPTIRFTVAGDGFSVNLRSRPTISTARVSRKDGIERTRRSLTVTVNGVAYSIEIFENLKPKQSLEEFIAESNAGFQHDPGAERKLTIDGFSGREYSSQTETTTTVLQFFATEDRLLRFAASGPVEAASAIAEFFSSIKLGPNTDGFDVSSGVLLETYHGERVYLGREIDVKARLLERTEPPYTKDARHNKIEGTVILRALFSKTGRVEVVRVIQGLPYGLTEQAMEAARKIKFVPAMKDGKAVSTWIQLEYNFSL